jgi:DNA-binding response OmpR family regulator
MTVTGRVLLVDDEEKIVKTLGRALREDGHQVTTTSRAVDGQRLLAEHSSTC